MSERVVKIVIPENIPSKNKGEAAILIGMIETFKCLGETTVTLFSKFPEEDKERYDRYSVRIVPYERNRFSSSSCWLLRRIRDIFNIIQFVTCSLVFELKIIRLSRWFGDECWKALLDCDVIIMGHDNVITSGVWTRHFALLLFAKILKKKIVVYEASIGPIRNKFKQGLMKVFLTKIDLVTLRDPISYDYVVEKLRVTNDKIFLTGDTAFLLKQAPKERIIEILASEAIKNNNQTIGLSISKYIVDDALIGNVDTDIKYKKFVKIIANTLDHLIQLCGVPIIVVPHAVGPSVKADDRIIAKDIIKYITHKSMVKNIDKEYTPEELKGIIGKCHLFIGARTHSTIASTGMCVPTIALTSSKRNKTNGIIGIMMEQNEWLYDVGNISYSSLFDLIKKAWFDRAKIRTKIEQKRQEAINGALLNGQLLKDLLEEKNRQKDDY